MLSLSKHRAGFFSSLLDSPLCACVPDSPTARRCERIMRFQIGLHLRAMLRDASFLYGSGRPLARGWVGGALLAFAISLGAQPCAAYDVMLRWTVPATSNATGYRVYTGSSSRTYNQHTDVGPRAASTLNGVVYYLYQGVPLGSEVYVAVTAYNSTRLDSDYSNEKVINQALVAPPQVDAGPDQTAPVGTSLTLGSQPQAGVSYIWEQTKGPPATLSSRTSSSTGFSATSAGTFTFSVTAYNAQGVAAQDSVSVTLTGRSYTATPAPIPTPSANRVGSDVLVRGNRRRPATDRSGCQVEWIVVSSGNTTDRFGLPSQNQACTDGDPSCDFLPDTPGLCEFHVRVCLNNADPNLPACTPGGIGDVEVLAPRPRAALGAASYAVLTVDADTLQNALNHLGNPRDAVAHSTYSPPLDPTEQGFCSEIFAIQAMVSNRVRRPSVTLKTRSGDYATLRRQISVSQLQLTCSPPAQ